LALHIGYYICALVLYYKMAPDIIKDGTMAQNEQLS